MKFVTTTLVGGSRDGEVISILQGVESVILPVQVSSAQHSDDSGETGPAFKREVYERHAVRGRLGAVTCYIVQGANIERELRRVGVLA